MEQEIQILHQSSSCKILLLKSENKQEELVKLVEHLPNQMHNINCLFIKQEFDILSTISHPNIIKLTNHTYFTQTQSKENPEVGYCGIQLERCQANLYQMLLKQFPYIVQFTQLKSWFFQIAGALKYVHEEKETFHFDVKLDNILIDFNNNAKLSDFGLCSLKKNCQSLKTMKLIWSRRNKHYLPSEAIVLCDLIDKNNDLKAQKMAGLIDWQKIDSFSFGISMFNAFMLCTPFQGERVQKNDPSMRYLYKKQNDQFWSSNSQMNSILNQYQQQQQINEKEIGNFKDLIQSLISFDPQERPNFQQILNHPFFSV